MAPARPELQVQTQPTRGAHDLEAAFRAICISREGRPPAQLQWFLGDEPILDGLNKPDIKVTPGSDGRPVYTIAQGIVRQLKVTDDHKDLTCRAVHPTDYNQPQESKYQILVRCKYEIKLIDKILIL